MDEEELHNKGRREWARSIGEAEGLENGAESCNPGSAKPLVRILDLILGAIRSHRRVFSRVEHD